LAARKSVRRSSPLRLHRSHRWPRRSTGIVCLISAYISGPWLYAIGVVLIIVGAVAIGNSESTIGKMISTVFVGLGLASVAIPIVKNHLMINYTCS
jgi:hypothetical protein